jgi:hypothetical protein
MSLIPSVWADSGRFSPLVLAISTDSPNVRFGSKADIQRRADRHLPRGSLSGLRATARQSAAWRRREKKMLQIASNGADMLMLSSVNRRSRVESCNRHQVLSPPRYRRIMTSSGDNQSLHALDL